MIAISAFSLLILGLPAIASAQWNGGYGGYGNNGGYGNGGYYGNGNVRSVVRNLKNKAERFENAVDRYDDRNDNRNNRGGWGNWGGWGNNNNYGGNLENLADQFKNATDDLEDAFGQGRNLNNSADEARRVLDLASAIDQQLRNSRGGRGNLFGQWNSMRQDLNVIAQTYGYYNNNNGNGRGNRNGGWRNNFPF
jgi:hypothetical protein